MKRGAQLMLVAALSSVATAAVVRCWPQDPSAANRRLRLDGSGAFFYPDALGMDALALIAGGRGVQLEAATYLRYLVSRHGFDLLDEAVYDILLVQECEALGLVRSAPTLAQGIATRRLSDSGRDPRSSWRTRLKFTNEALRRQRVDALVVARRPVSDGELRALFERRYGKGGVSQRARQIMVSFAATQARLAASGRRSDRNAVEVEAQSRATRFSDQVRSGAAFEDLLPESDVASRAGVSDGLVTARRALRYGSAFRSMLARLEPGQVGTPVRSSYGFHVVQLLERTTTVFEDVVDDLRQQLKSGSPTTLEQRQLRIDLFEKYGIDLSAWR